jgi:hypothetical protein
MLTRLGLSLLLFGAPHWSIAWAQGTDRFDGEYVGELTLTAVISGDCTEPPPGAVYVLRISKGTVQFQYVPRFDTTLIGRVLEDGSFEAFSRLKKGVVEMKGRIDGGRVIADLRSPSCTYTFRTTE